MIFYYSLFSTALGEFCAAVDDSGAVVATAFGNAAELRRRLVSNSGVELVTDESRTKVARQQICAFLNAERNNFRLRLQPAGTDFQQRVWQELCAIPFGETRSYGDLAKKLRSSPRAVGRANATNPICLIIPCHRVIGADGSLTGFAFGEEVKRRLLELEGALVAT